MRRAARRLARVLAVAACGLPTAGGQAQPDSVRAPAPTFVADTARFVAALRGVTPEHLAETTTRNFTRLFTKAGL